MLSEAIVGELPPPTEGVQRVPAYETIRLEEFHQVGPDGRPARHRTVQTIRALTDGVSSHRYIFDLGEARVEAIHGGTPGDPYRIKGNLWAVDLSLPKVLNQGDEHTLEYVTSFRDTESPVEPCFRRAAHRRVENASFHVSFDPRCLPSGVWWAMWADYRPPNDRVVSRVSIPLDSTHCDSSHCVAQRVRVLERAVAGFVWEFDPDTDH